MGGSGGDEAISGRNGAKVAGTGNLSCRSQQPGQYEITLDRSSDCSGCTGQRPHCENRECKLKRRSVNFDTPGADVRQASTSGKPMRKTGNGTAELAGPGSRRAWIGAQPSGSDRQPRRNYTHSDVIQTLGPNAEDKIQREPDRALRFLMASLLVAADGARRTMANPVVQNAAEVVDRMIEWRRRTGIM